MKSLARVNLCAGASSFPLPVPGSRECTAGAYASSPVTSIVTPGTSAAASNPSVKRSRDRYAPSLGSR